MLSILRLPAQRGHVDHMRVRVKAPSIHARNIACRGDGDQHLVLPSREVEDLPATGLVELGEHIVEDHDRLDVALRRNHFVQRHFQGQRHCPHLAVRSEFAGWHVVEPQCQIIALRSDQILPTGHFAGVDALEMTADFRGRLVEQKHLVEGRLIHQVGLFLFARQRSIDAGERLAQQSDHIVPVLGQLHAEGDELAGPHFQTAQHGLTPVFGIDAGAVRQLFEQCGTLFGNVHELLQRLRITGQQQ